MQLTKTTTVVMGASEIVQAIKKLNPHDILIQALPSNGSGVYLELVNAGKGLSLSWERRTTSPQIKLASENNVVNINTHPSWRGDPEDLF